MMGKTLLIFLTIILSLVFLAGYNSNPKVIISRVAQNEIISTDELRYRVYFLGVIPAGEAVLHQERIEDMGGQRFYHLTAAAKTLNFFSRLFNGEVILESFVDTYQFNPVLFRQKIAVSGRNDVNKEVTYSQKDGFMSVGGVKRQISPNTQDPLSAMFNIEHMDFEKTKEFKMNINSYKINYILEGTARNKDILTKGKTYKTIILKGRIKRLEKNPYHQTSITMVLLKQRINIPVLINVFSGGIFIKARLITNKKGP